MVVRYQKMSNKKLGNSFETDFCQLLYQHGFWVHNFVQSKDGQPADVIAVKNGKAYLIDCKVCSNNYFNLGRMEENQINAMTLWEDVGNGNGLFAIRLAVDNSILMLTKQECLSLLKEQKQIGFKKLIQLGKSLNQWLGEVE